MADESDLDTSILPIEEDSTDFLDESSLDMDCESMFPALTFYNNILDSTESKDFKKKPKKAIRMNALAIVKIVASQKTYIAQLEGRIQAMEQTLTASNSIQQALITEVVARELEKKFPAPLDNPRTSFATVTKKNASQPIKNSVTINTTKKQHLAVIKPIDVSTTSSDTKSFIKKAVDITRVRIGVKKVASIKNGGILIEMVNEDDLSTLLKELDYNTSVKEKFTVVKPLKRKPQFICYGVSEETTAESVKASIMRHSPRK
ncbi:hypothetical protein CDAR_452971 [Caerostris darwini]|uniref:Uncharacterized protein n=1 Tax=Caerostris darwini TaxID=1538125 RepID=A0AAV4VCT4_9ARAC|nr:hypothetical protein CDAR_452971 [Caerostris darwini]